MKIYLMFTILVLSSLLTYKAQGIRLGKVTLSPSNHEDIVKISLVKGSSEDGQSLVQTAEISSGTNRKLMTKIISSKTTTIITKSDEYKHDPEAEVQSTHGLIGKEETSSFNSLQNSKHWKTEVSTKHYPYDIDIAGMDYTPARKKSPVHN
ncbi:uncharacterized protein LOC112516949 isoform X2 [Cynara cardunculus var. scolymus]|uniref:uncharacterized protein LOC112516949 isoform X2 n=1 Tax=Cynara cardunculus var. scolymus TaxID=59895 RepID=UPI000D62FBFD|nr:uncharacterized protein LOC112516949 isoform X2 [Cynara cardunculus var. scolymus]